MSDTIFNILVATTWQSIVLTLSILAVASLLGERLQPRFRHMLWCVVLARLALPVLPPAPWGYWHENAAPAARVAEPVAFEPTVVGSLIFPTEITEPVARSVARPGVAAQPESIPVRSPSLVERFQTFPWQSGILAAWVIGIAVFGFRYVLDELRLYRQSRYWKPVVDPVLLALFERCCTELGFRRRITFLSVPRGIGAAATGIFRPKILLAERVLAGDPDRLRLVLLHELAHIRRYDPLVLRLATVLSIVHWPNPAAWFLASRVRRDCELACDAAVLHILDPANRKEYGRAVLAFAELFSARKLLPGLVGAFRDDYQKHAITRRIDMILKHRKSKRLHTVLGCLLVLAVAGFGLTKAQSPRNTESGETRTFEGRVIDSKTEKPIEGVVVAVQCWKSGKMFDQPEQCFAESFCKTGADGKYRFTVTKEQASEPELHLKIMTDHPAYMTIGSDFRSYADAVFSAENEKGGGRFGNMRLDPAVKVSGRIVDADGKPVYPCNVNVFWVAYDDHFSDRFYGITDRDGKFESKIEPGKAGVVKIIPHDFAPKTVPFNLPQGGDLGTIRVERGMILSGRTLNADGKPLGGVRINVQERPADADRYHPQCLVWRTTDSDAEGYFKTRPLLPGAYRIAALPYTMESPYGDFNHNQMLSGMVTREYMGKAKNAPWPKELPVPGIFSNLRVDFHSEEPIEYRASQSNTISFRCLDRSGKSFGKPVTVLIYGNTETGVWELQEKDVLPDANGNLSVRVPHGLADTVLMVRTGMGVPDQYDNHPVRYRLAKDGPLKNDWLVDLGSVDADLGGIEVSPYKAARVTMFAKDGEGKYFDDYSLWHPSVEYKNTQLYKDDATRFGFAFGFGGLGRAVSISKVRNDDGKEVPARGRQVWVLADEPFTLNVRRGKDLLDNRMLKLAEGEEKTVTFTLP